MYIYLNKKMENSNMNKNEQKKLSLSMMICCSINQSKC